MSQKLSDLLLQRRALRGLAASSRMQVRPVPLSSIQLLEGRATSSRWRLWPAVIASLSFFCTVYVMVHDDVVVAQASSFVAAIMAELGAGKQPASHQALAKSVGDIRGASGVHRGCRCLWFHS